MPKMRPFPTRSFGSEQPPPSAGELAGLVGRMGGHTADYLTFQVVSSFLPQVGAGIGVPCAGGLFYGKRIAPDPPGAGPGTDIPEPDLEMIGNDLQAVRSMSGSFAVAFPSPSNLAGQAAPAPAGRDPDELFLVYRRVIRITREQGSVNQILFANEFMHEELEVLGGGKTLFFPLIRTEKTLSEVLEFQRVLVVSSAELDLAEEIAGSYQVSRVVVLDPDETTLERAAAVFDDDRVEAGGYCTGSCMGYWEDLVKKAQIRVNRQPRQVF